MFIINIAEITNKIFVEITQLCHFVAIQRNKETETVRTDNVKLRRL
jgi:hypothetical protein